MGNPVSPEALPGARGVMMIPVPEAGLLRRVEGLSAAKKVPHVTSIDIVIPEGHELVPLPEGNQYPGYIFAQSDDPESVVGALREAHQQLNFVVSPLWKIGTAHLT